MPEIKLISAKTGQVVGTFWEEDPDPPPLTIEDYKAAIKARRDQAMAAGTVVNGMPVKADMDSMTLISGAHSYVVQNPLATIMFAVGGTHVELDAAQVTAVAVAVAAHAQACFRVEADKLAAGTI